jgi:LmbE family N-acetylglucosaminyl deacetylase
MLRGSRARRSGTSGDKAPRREFLWGSAFASLAGARLASGQAGGAPRKVEQAGKTSKAKKTFLAIEGHMDDAEIGAGGVLIQAARAGHRVVVVTVVSDLSSWEATVGREEKTKGELLGLAKRFGFEKRFLDYPYHQIHGGDLELKRKLAEVYVELKPDVAFIPHYEDHWPDHVASGVAAHDALLFSHGLTREKSIRRCPLIYAYDVSPIQTYHFEPDVYYDITDVMPAYMDLLARIDSIRSGTPLKDAVQHEFRALSGGLTLPLSGHGLTRFADCVRFGNRTECPFALGFRTVWGQRRGESLL